MQRTTTLSILFSLLAISTAIPAHANSWAAPKIVVGAASSLSALYCLYNAYWWKREADLFQESSGHAIVARYYSYMDVAGAVLCGALGAYALTSGIRNLGK